MTDAASLPRALLFCPVEKVIRADDEVISLIALIERIVINHGGGADDEPLPSGALAPMTWALFSFWERQQAETEERFEISVTALIAGSGDVVMATGATPLLFPVGYKRMRVNQPVFGFPAAHKGDVDLVLAIRRNGDAEWEERARYTVAVDHQPIVIEQGAGGG